MKILVINSGSSSIKFQLISMPEGSVLAKGLIERIGFEDAIIHYKTEGNSIEKVLKISNHQEGLEQITALLLADDYGVIPSAEAISAVGHRVVHGGSVYKNYGSKSTSKRRY